MTSRPGHVRTMSPSLSTAGSQHTLGQSPRLNNMVTKLAIEGKSKKGEDGAAIRMYLKITLPTDTVVPGSTIPLFPEENLKILTSQVHPIDSTGVPYNFSTTTCPLLHSAARALGLPARSSQSYLLLFGGLPGASTNFGSLSRGTSSNSANPPPLDDKYCGHILVSGYSVSYVLPKEFPPRYKIGEDHDGRATPSRTRRPSMSDKSSIHFMAAIEMWIPYVSKPQKAPYLLSIPLPKCLSNSVKMRIFPPNTKTSSSFASLSSAEDEGSPWDLTADPHVTRSTSTRPSRAHSYNAQNFADDESSDSSTAGFSEGCGIQGTFPSSERLRLRWASPVKAADGVDDGRRRVGVTEVKGDTTCIIIGQGKQKHSVLMKVEYKGSCKGVWFPGVATMLGMDVALEAPGSDVKWAETSEPNWDVTGGNGYTGFDNGGSQPRIAISRQSSVDSSAVYVRPGGLMANGRHESTSSSTSLLRAPLPAQGLADYSFEGSGSGVSGTSSMGSLGPTSNPYSQQFGDAARPPIAVTTLHINMNELLPPVNPKGVFTFAISGTILVAPKSVSSRRENDGEPEAITLPRFKVLAAESESSHTMVRNDLENVNVEVFNSTGDLRDAQTRKTVLQKAGYTRCGSDGGRIALRALKRNAWGDQESADVSSSRLPPSRPRTPNGLTRVASTSFSRVAVPAARPKRDGALVIPSVQATVTPLVLAGAASPHGYAVRLRLPAPADAESDWLEFGLAQPSPALKSPRVEIASAAVDGVPVNYEVTSASKSEGDGLSDLEEKSSASAGNDWVSWVRVHVGGSGSAEVLVDYVVHADVKGKGKEDALLVNVLLPTFALPVSRLEVIVDTDLVITTLRSNLLHQQTTPSGRRLLRYTCPEMYHPHLSLAIKRSPQPMSRAFRVAAWTVPNLFSLVFLLWLVNVGSEIRELRHAIDDASYQALPPTTPLPVEPVTVTLTTTIVSTRWHEPPVATSKPVTPPPLQPSSAHEPKVMNAPLPVPESTVTYTPIPIPTYTPNYDILPAYTLPFLWGLKIDLPPIVHVAVEKVAAGWTKIWQAARVVYHYPLDPP